MKNNRMIPGADGGVIVTAGSSYLDIDAYACSVALRDLLRLKGERAIAYSPAPCNYSVCPGLKEAGQMETVLPAGWDVQACRVMIVDVSDPDYIRGAVPLDNVVALYDHHTGFEAYWESRIGQSAHIAFIGAAATLIFGEWKDGGVLDQMTRSTALLLIAAILDNTLNLTSANTTDADREAFDELCRLANVGKAWCDAYFAEVQAGVEADLQNALLKDIKRIGADKVLPEYVAQLCVWDADRIIAKLDTIRGWFTGRRDSWMINVIDIRRRRSYFVCDDKERQQMIGAIFNVSFEDGVAVLPVSYLRKEIIKKIKRHQ